MIGIRIDTNPGVVNCAMTGIMNMIAKIKQELKDAKTKAQNVEVDPPENDVSEHEGREECW